jgi:hypothetical protein
MIDWPGIHDRTVEGKNRTIARTASVAQQNPLNRMLPKRITRFGTGNTSKRVRHVQKQEPNSPFGSCPFLGALKSEDTLAARLFRES